MIGHAKFARVACNASHTRRLPAFRLSLAGPTHCHCVRCRGEAVGERAAARRVWRPHPPGRRALRAHEHPQELAPGASYKHCLSLVVLSARARRCVCGLPGGHSSAHRYLLRCSIYASIPAALWRTRDVRSGSCVARVECSPSPTGERGWGCKLCMALVTRTVTRLPLSVLTTLSSSCCAQRARLGRSRVFISGETCPNLFSPAAPSFCLQLYRRTP